MSQALKNIAESVNNGAYLTPVSECRNKEDKLSAVIYSYLSYHMGVPGYDSDGHVLNRRFNYLGVNKPTLQAEVSFTIS